MKRRLGFAGLLLTVLFSLGVRGFGWWDEGHRWVNLVALESMPADVPEFFRKAGARIGYLGAEPDRWNDNHQLFSALREFNAPEHFIDIDQPDDFKALPDDRYKYSEWLQAKGKKASQVGLLPYACLEWYEKLEISFRLWRNAGQAEVRGHIEDNIIYYAGVMGHYVADAANPLHTTANFNGWTTSWNPEGFSRGPIHARFEGEFVNAKIRQTDLKRLVRTARVVPDPFSSIAEHLRESSLQVRELYRLEKIAHWGAENTNPECKSFAEKRLAAGAQMLADLWYTAWVDSAVGNAAGFSRAVRP